MFFLGFSIVFKLFTLTFIYCTSSNPPGGKTLVLAGKNKEQKRVQYTTPGKAPDKNIKIRIIRMRKNSRSYYQRVPIVHATPAVPF